MLVVPPPLSQHFLKPGQVFFTMSNGFISDGIARETAPQRYEAGQLVATHVGVVLEDGYVAEAWQPDWRIAPLRERLEQRDSLVWLKEPAGQTEASAAALCQAARDLEGTPYDYGGVIGFTLSDNDDQGQDPNWLENRKKFFCSEGVDVLLRQTEHLRTVPLPEPFKLVHSSWRSPQGLNVAPIWAAPSLVYLPA
jgi:hypothetical protein